MIGRLNHVAIAVPDLGAATATYRDTLGAAVSQPQDLPEHGVDMWGSRFVGTATIINPTLLDHSIRALAASPFKCSGYSGILIDDCWTTSPARGTPRPTASAPSPATATPPRGGLCQTQQNSRMASGR